MKKYNYKEDRFAKTCLDMANKTKSNIGFGAVLVKNGKIIGKGRNRRSTVEDRKRLTHVDYAIHAEQACILDATDNGHSLKNAEVYVIGVILSGPFKGKLTIREHIGFGCTKCPHTFIRFGIPVNIPHRVGWKKLTPEEAMETANNFWEKGKWEKFSKGLVTI